MDLSELINAVDILEYISQYTDFTEKNGEHWALSPFKDEKTPSFSVRREAGTFYDFSSGIGGNLLTFVKHYHNCSASEAVKKIQDYAGVDGKVTQHKALSVTQIAKRFAKPTGRQKVINHKILPDNYMDRYELNIDKMKIWEDEGISPQSLTKFGVKYDSFSNRLVYPIRDTEGRIINVGGRTLDRDWKNKGLRKYTYFMSWGELDTIYGFAENLEEIRKKREIILFEGAKSVMLAHSWGVTNCAAILTSHVNPNQMKILRNLGCDVVFAFDKDVNIKNDFNAKKLKQFVNVSYIWDRENLLDEKDAPVDKGKEVWQKLYEGRLVWH